MARLGEYIVLGALLVLLFGAIAVTENKGEPVRQPVTTPQTTAAGTPETRAKLETPETPVTSGSVEIAVGDKPQGIVTGIVRGQEMLWVASLGTRSIERLDPRTARVADAVPLDIAPLGLAFGNGAVWITGGFNTVERLDPETNRVTARITVGMNPRIPVVNEDGVWVPNANDRTVSRIDSHTNRVIDTIRAGDPLDCPTSPEPLALAAGRGSVWVTQCGRESVARIDPRTGRLLDMIYLGIEPTGLQLADDTLWVTSHSYDRVLRVDVQNRRVVAIIPVSGPGAITAAAGTVWVETSAGRLVRINTQTDQVVDSTPAGVGAEVTPPSPVPSLPGVMMGTGLGSLAASQGSVWASRVGSSVVVRIDPGPTK